MRNYLNMEVEQTFTDGGKYVDEGVLEEHTHFEEAVHEYESMDIRNFASDVYTLALSELTKALNPFMDRTDTLDALFKRTTE